MKTLKLNHCEWHNNVIHLLSTSRNIENLLHLNLSNVFSNKEGEENLELIATKCPNLESISFERWISDRNQN